MEMRKVIAIGNMLGVGLPKTMLRLIQAEKGDYLQVFLADDHTIVIRKPTEEKARRIRYDATRAREIVARTKHLRVPADLDD